MRSIISLIFVPKPKNYAVNEAAPPNHEVCQLDDGRGDSHCQA